MKHQISNGLIGSVVLVAALAIGQQASARTNWYNFPSEAKVKITKDQYSQSWIYLEFLWGEEGVPEEEQKCKPNFNEGQAVEFEVVITPKCFLMPAGGKDNKYKCEDVMGKLGIGFNLPDNYLPEIDANNCYVDVWNYWIPSPDDVVAELHQQCSFDSSGDHCAWWATALGAFKENTGNFAVGLHDASALKAGERYSFRYPVEINNSYECQLNAYNFHSEIAKRCVSGTSEDSTADTVWEDPTLGYVVKRPFDQEYTVRNEWGRVQITMQTFNNHCDLGPGCDSVAKAYTCPHLIGAVNGSDSSCIDAEKETDFWISRLCVPTDDYKFTPGYGIELSKYEQSTMCITEQNYNDLYTHNACCIDLDNDGYYGNTGELNSGIYSPVEVYGHQTGDCDDTDYSVHPNTSEICWDGKDNNCDGKQPETDCWVSITDDCPEDSQCKTGEEMMATCPNGDDVQHVVCNDLCVWEALSECPTCGNEGEACCPGNICTGSLYCNGAGLCNLCPAGQTTCGTGVCVSLEGNVDHCYGCNNKCEPGQVCLASGCAYQDCTSGETESANCDVGVQNCPTGTKTRACDSGTWGQYSACESPYKYYGWGGKGCGETSPKDQNPNCIQLSTGGSNGSITATLSKHLGGNYGGQVVLRVKNILTGDTQNLGCVNLTNLSTYQFSVSPSQLGAEYGEFIRIKAELIPDDTPSTSGCTGTTVFETGQNYISGCRK